MPNNTNYTLGRVGIVARGEYSATTEYEPLDLVSSGGSSYLAVQASTGQPVTNTSYWMLAVQGNTNVSYAATLPATGTTGQICIVPIV